MIEKGFAQAVPDLERALADAGTPPVDEAVLHWLGMHFLNWWGREEEALDVFRLAARLYPRSSRALDLLGQALAARGRIEDGVACLEKALALDPGNKALAARLERVKGSLRDAK